MPGLATVNLESRAKAARHLRVLKMQSLRSGISPKAVAGPLCKASAPVSEASPVAKGILYRKALRTASSRSRRACADCFRSRLRRLGFASPPRARPRSGRGQTTTPSPRARSKPELSTLLETGTFYFALTCLPYLCFLLMSPQVIRKRAALLRGKQHVREPVVNWHDCPAKSRWRLIHLVRQPRVYG